DYATVAYAASDGGTMWERRYNGPRHSRDEAWAVVFTPDGAKAIVTGFSYGTNGSLDYLTIAYGADTGTPSWIERYDAPAHNADRGEAEAVSPDGSTVFVTGWSHGGPTNWDYATVAYRT